MLNFKEHTPGLPAGLGRSGCTGPTRRGVEAGVVQWLRA